VGGGGGDSSQSRIRETQNVNGIGSIYYQSFPRVIAIADVNCWNCFISEIV